MVSYNIHRCIGTDGHLRPSRILAVLRELDADVVALQEVAVRADPSGVPDDQLAYLSRSLGYQVVAGPNLLVHRGRFGNAILTRVPVIASEPVDLAVPGFEPRAAIDVHLDWHGRRLRVVATHLGLRRNERREQIARLTAALASGRDPPAVTIVLGDFNEWLQSRTTLLPLDSTLGQSMAPRTFPARFPTFRLDRIWVRPAHLVRDVRAVATAETRVASDHLPLRTMIALP